jgi:hypothetical protein
MYFKYPEHKGSGPPASLHLWTNELECRTGICREGQELAELQGWVLGVPGTLHVVVHGPVVNGAQWDSFTCIPQWCS